MSEFSGYPINSVWWLVEGRGKKERKEEGEKEEEKRKKEK